MDFKNVPANIGMLDNTAVKKIMTIPFPMVAGNFWDFFSGNVGLLDFGDYALLLINVSFNGTGDATYYKDFTFNVDLEPYGKKVELGGYTRLSSLQFKTDSFRVNCSTAQKTSNPLIISMGFATGTSVIESFSSLYVIPLANA